MSTDKVPVEKRQSAIQKILKGISTFEKLVKDEESESRINCEDVLSGLDKIRERLSVEPTPSSKTIMIENTELDNARYYLCYLYSNSLKN